MLGVKVIRCRPGDPGAKGSVERANGYYGTSFPPGRNLCRPSDFNAQLFGVAVAKGAPASPSIARVPAD